MQSTNYDSMMYTIESHSYYAFSIASCCCLTIHVDIAFYDTFQVLQTLTMMPLIARPFWVSNVILHYLIQFLYMVTHWMHVLLIIYVPPLPPTCG